MIRAGVVAHPKEWQFGGHREVMNPKNRYQIIDFESLMEFFGVKNHHQLKNEYHSIIQRALKTETFQLEPDWTKSITIGNESFIIDIQEKLGMKVFKRKIEHNDNCWILHEPS